MSGTARVNEDDLRVVQVAAIDVRTETPWLVEGLWVEDGVGIVGGAPKSMKTWLALDLSLSVATGTAALGKYPVRSAGPVLVFAAEDSPESVRTRIEGLAKGRGLEDLRRIPLHLIVESTLRLDRPVDRRRLERAVLRLRPRLLLLDPFVRIQRIDENSSLEVSGVLAYLRSLQREYQVAVIVVHHTRKAAGASYQAGLSLRGSSDFYAWGDSYLYLRRYKERLELLVEHRNAEAPDPVGIELRTEEDLPYLAISRSPTTGDSEDVVREQILELLSGKKEPLTQEAIRLAIRVRTQRVVTALRSLEREQRVVRGTSGWLLLEDEERIDWKDPGKRSPGKEVKTTG